MLQQTVKYFEHGGTVILIETDTETLYIDVFDKNGAPVDLSEATTYFHLMEFSTRENIWSKECSPIYDPNGGISNVTCPYTVPVLLASSDTLNLEGHYVGQLELIDLYGNSKVPFQIDIIIVKKAGL